MQTMLWWWLEYPAQCFHCLCQQQRSAQQYWRSGVFHGARVLKGPASWPDKWTRLARRSRADAITLCHDSLEPLLDLQQQSWLRPRCPEAMARPWARGAQRMGRSLQQGCVQLGREWSRRD